MNWEFLERWKKFLQLKGVARGGRDEATARVRDAFSDAGAWITDVHFFSGMQTVFNFEVAPDRARALGEGLAGAGIDLDASSRAALESAAGAEGELQGTLAVIFAQGDPNLKHEVPAVPG